MPVSGPKLTAGSHFHNKPPIGGWPLPSRPLSCMTGDLDFSAAELTCPLQPRVCPRAGRLTRRTEISAVQISSLLPLWIKNPGKCRGSPSCSSPLFAKIGVRSGSQGALPSTQAPGEASGPSLSVAAHAGACHWPWVITAKPGSPRGRELVFPWPAHRDVAVI